VDGFDEDEAESKGNNGAVVLGRRLAAERDPFEPLELANELLDAGAGAIERFRKEPWPVLGRRPEPITGQMLCSRATEWLALLSYPLSPTAARGVMSGPRSSRISNGGLSLA